MSMVIVDEPAIAAQADQDIDSDETSAAGEWAAEIERRVKAARSGQVELLDGPSAVDEIFE